MVCSRRSLGLAAGLFVLALCLGGCVTSGMWSEDTDNDVYNSVDYEGGRSSGMSVWAKIALTPLTLAVDIVSLPVVAFMKDPFGFFGDDDDDDDDDERFPRDPKIPRAPPPTPPAAPTPPPTKATATTPKER